MNDVNNKLRNIFGLLATDPMASAAAIEELADQLRGCAAKIRQAVVENRDPRIVPGGMKDVVKMSVVGPDGIVKQTIDTSKN